MVKRTNTISHPGKHTYLCGLPQCGCRIYVVKRSFEGTFLPRKMQNIDSSAQFVSHLPFSFQQNIFFYLASTWSYPWSMLRTAKNSKNTRKSPTKNGKEKGDQTCY